MKWIKLNKGDTVYVINTRNNKPYYATGSVQLLIGDRALVQIPNMALRLRIPLHIPYEGYTVSLKAKSTYMITVNRNNPILESIRSRELQSYLINQVKKLSADQLEQVIGFTQTYQFTA